MEGLNPAEANYDVFCCLQDSFLNISAGEFANRLQVSFGNANGLQIRQPP